MEHKQFDAVVTEINEDQGIVKAIFAVMGNIDGGKDRIHPGAFTKTFAERGNQIMVLDNHRTDSVMSILGKPLMFRELGRNALPAPLVDAYPDATGAAEVDVQFLLDTPEGKGAFTRIKGGALRKWSFGYDPQDSDYETIKADDGEITIRNLRTIKLYELSPVLFAMNEATMTTGVKNDELDAEPEADEVAEELAAEMGLRLIIDGVELELADEQKQAITQLINPAPVTGQAAIETNEDKQAGPGAESEPPTSEDALDAVTVEDMQRHMMALHLLEVNSR